MMRASGPARERATAALVMALACGCCTIIAAAVRDLDQRTAARQRQLEQLAGSARAGAPGAVPALDGLFPGLQVLRESSDHGCHLRLLPSVRSGERT